MVKKAGWFVGAERHSIDLAEGQLLGTYANAIAVGKNVRRAEQAPIHSRAVAAAHVFEHRQLGADSDTCMMPRNERIDQRDAAVRTPTNECVSGWKVELLQQEPEPIASQKSPFVG